MRRLLRVVLTSWFFLPLAVACVPLAWVMGEKYPLRIAATCLDMWWNGWES